NGAARMKRYLLDTNHLSEAVYRVSVVRDRIQQMCRQGTVFGTCGPVLCELLVGVVKRRDRAATRRRLEGLRQVVRVWPVELAVAGCCDEFYQDAKKAGGALSQVNITWAAMPPHLDPLLLRPDQVFKALPDIGLKNCLT